MKQFQLDQRNRRVQHSRNMVYSALNRTSEKDILAEFTKEQQTEIKQKLLILSSLAYFIGRDFHIPVELNEVGAGWHWDFENNVIRVDPQDILEKSMDYLRFVISHEGGHRRTSRVDLISSVEWQQPGFSFMMNAIEDPRVNNFVAECYPKFKEQMVLVYRENVDFEAKSKEKANQKLGFQPRFMQAGFEYIRQWFSEVEGKPTEISEDVQGDVREVVNATLVSARDSWLRYPSRHEADESEDIIKQYAKLSYEINRDEVWPEFKKLVDEDMKDQQMQEFLKDLQQGNEGDERGESTLPSELKEKLTPEEQQNLEEALKQAIDAEQKEHEEKTQQEGDKEDSDGQKLSTTDAVDTSSEITPKKSHGKPIDLDSLSPELKQKIKEHIASMSDEQQTDLVERAEKILKDFEESLNDELQGKLSDNPIKKEEREGSTEISTQLEKDTIEPVEEKNWKERERIDEKNAQELRKKIEDVVSLKHQNPYETALIQTSDMIDALTADLRDVFIARKKEKHETGFRSGRRWNIRQRIREKIEGIPLFKTEAREQRSVESEERDYAVTLLIDLSGSMNGVKIKEAFTSAVVLAETLNNLGIAFEIVGFQDRLLEYKTFTEHLDEPMRQKLHQMILEVSNSNPEGHNQAQDNDDGVCLQAASEHLATQTARNKFLIVLSDGVPWTTYKSQQKLDQELKDVIAEITTNTQQKLIGIGLMSQAVEKYYPNHIAGVTTKAMVETLGGLLREIIERN